MTFIEIDKGTETDWVNPAHVQSVHVRFRPGGWTAWAVLYTGDTIHIAGPWLSSDGQQLAAAEAKAFIAKLEAE